MSEEGMIKRERDDEEDSSQGEQGDPPAKRVKAEVDEEASTNDSGVHGTNDSESAPVDSEENVESEERV